MHLTGSAIPVIEITNNTNSCCCWSPYRKLSSSNTASDHRMSAKLLINMVVNATSKFYEILSVHERSKSIRIIYSMFFTFSILDDVLIFELIDVRNNSSKKTCLISQLHLIFLASLLHPHFNSICIRIKSLNQITVSYFMCTENSVRIITIRIDNLLNLRPIHHFIQFTSHCIPLQNE